jgi:hypothetical protein
MAVCLPTKGFATSLTCLPTRVILPMSVVPKPSASSLVRCGTLVGSHFRQQDRESNHEEGPLGLASSRVEHSRIVVRRLLIWQDIFEGKGPLRTYNAASKG